MEPAQVSDGRLTDLADAVSRARGTLDARRREQEAEGRTATQLTGRSANVESEFVKFCQGDSTIDVEAKSASETSAAALGMGSHVRRDRQGTVEHLMDPSSLPSNARSSRPCASTVAAVSARFERRAGHRPSSRGHEPASRAVVYAEKHGLGGLSWRPMVLNVPKGHKTSPWPIKPGYNPPRNNSRQAKWAVEYAE